MKLHLNQGKWKRIALACLTYVLFQVSGFGQINFLVGYDLGYYPDCSANALFQVHNSNNDWYKNGLEDITFQHGLQLGLRYSWPYISAVVSYKNAGVSSEAEGVPANFNESFTRRISLRSNVVGLGLETHQRFINFGISLDYNHLRISSKTSSLNNSYDVQDHGFWSGRLYLNLEFSGDQYIGFAIQPYYSLPLAGFSLEPLANELEVQQKVDWNSAIFGCTFLLTNGPRWD